MIVFYLNIFFNAIYACIFCIKFSVSHDLSEILKRNPEILKSWFAAQETLLFIINVENICATYSFFVETLIIFSDPGFFIE